MADDRVEKLRRERGEVGGDERRRRIRDRLATRGRVGTGHTGEHVQERVADMRRNRPPKGVTNGEATYEHTRGEDNGHGWWQGHEAWSNLCAGCTMGVVYGAWDRVLERDVALKVMRRDVSESERYRERFLREGRTAAALDHPNVVRVHDVDPAACTLILERVRGESLALRLRRRGRLPRGEALRVARADSSSSPIATTT